MNFDIGQGLRRGAWAGAKNPLGAVKAVARDSSHAYRFSMDWYAAKEGIQVGPMTEVRLREMLDAGELTAESLVWRDGLPNWQPLSSVFPERFSERGGMSSFPSEAMATCAVSGRVLPASQMLHYGEVSVAPEHKDAFVQGLREGSAPSLQPPAGRLNGYAYQTPKMRATLAKFAMLSMTVSGAIMPLIELLAPESDPEVLTPADLLAALTGLVILISLVLSAVFFSMWTHRVVANAHAFGGRFNTISPGWAVGWYFIPFANLVKPYHALKEAWQTTFDEEKVPSLLPAWWGFWIVSNIMGNISLRLTMNGMEEAAVMLDLVTVAINIPLLVFVWQVVSRLTERQMHRGEGGQRFPG